VAGLLGYAAPADTSSTICYGANGPEYLLPM
jgi:hypothetical protein